MTTPTPGQAAYETWRDAVPDYVCNVPAGPWEELPPTVRAGFDAVAARERPAPCAYCEDDPGHPEPDNAGSCTCMPPGCGRGWCPQRDDEAQPAPGPAELQFLLDGERSERLHRAGERDEARSDLRRMHRLALDVLATLPDDTARARRWHDQADAIIGRHLEPAPELAAAQWTGAELDAALDGFYGWFTVTGGGARVQGQLLGADAAEFARELHAQLDANRAHL